jgi:hypothetical protein
MELASLVVVERAYEATFLRRPRSCSSSTSDPHRPSRCRPRRPPPQADLDARPLLCHAVTLGLGYGQFFCLPA